MSGDLVCACDGDHLDVVRFLVLQERKADVNEIDNFGNSPLHIACLRGHLDIVRFLSEKTDVDVGIECGEIAVNNHRF